MCNSVIQQELESGSTVAVLPGEYTALTSLEFKMYLKQLST